MAEINEKFEVKDIDLTCKFVLLFDCFIKSHAKWSAKVDDPPLPHVYTV